MKLSKSFIGIGLALLATFLWSANLVVARGLSSLVPPISLAFYRWLIALIILIPITYKAFIRQWPIVKKNLVFFILAALLGVTFFNTLIYFAGKTTTATNLSLIAITAPIYIIILSRIFYKEKFPIKSLFGIILTFIGILYLISKGDYTFLLELKFMQGDILMFIAAICFAGYSVLMKKKPEGIDMTVVLLVTIFIGTIFLVPAYITEYLKSEAIKFTPTIIASLLYVGIINSIIAFYCWNRAILIIGSQEAGIIYYSLPVFSSTLAIIILNEEIKIYHLYSLLLIFIGMYTASYFKMKKQNTSSNS